MWIGIISKIRVRHYSAFHNDAEELIVKLEPTKKKVFGKQEKWMPVVNYSIAKFKEKTQLNNYNFNIYYTHSSKHCGILHLSGMSATTLIALLSHTRGKSIFSALWETNWVRCSGMGIQFISNSFGMLEFLCTFMRRISGREEGSLHILKTNAPLLLGIKTLRLEGRRLVLI